MELVFSTTGIIGQGKYPDFLQFPKTEGQLFYLIGEEMYGKPSEKLNGEYSSPTWLSPIKISPDVTIKQLELQILQGFGVVGSYRTSDAHKLLIYEFAFEMERYLNSGSIKHSMDTPIASFTLGLDNPLNENPEYEGNVAISEESSLLSPGSKVEFELVMGDSEPYQWEYSMWIEAIFLFYLKLSVWMVET